MVSRSSDSNDSALDVVVIGAGINGLYLLHRFRTLGLNVRVLEAGDGVGGTWYWNRYPGARLDVETYTYQYFFSQEVLKEWSWTEEFAGQPEVEKYLNFVTDKLELRPDIEFNSRVTAAVWDESANLWTVRDHHDREWRATFVVTAVGILSAPQYPRAPGLETFAGEKYHTGLWPKEPVQFAGKRVAVVGTGSSGVQVIPKISEEARRLTVFQRTPNWCTPLGNSPISPERMEEIKASYEETYSFVRSTGSGFMHVPPEGSVWDLSEEERTALFQRAYDAAGMTMLYEVHPEVLSDRAANDLLTKFLAEKIRQRVNDPETARKLIPDDHGFGEKRPPLETNYYESYNREHVELISLGEEPIERFTETGIQTSARHLEFDMIVLATGFDAVTGSFMRMEIVGVGGATLREAWADGPHTYLGIQTPGFPNLFMAAGPQSVRGNLPRFTEPQITWITDCIDLLHSKGIDRIEATAEATLQWVKHVNDTAPKPLYPDGRASVWIFGTNIPGKAKAFLACTDPLPVFRARLEEVATHMYEGFLLGEAPVSDDTEAGVTGWA